MVLTINRRAIRFLTTLFYPVIPLRNLENDSFVAVATWRNLRALRSVSSNDAFPAYQIRKAIRDLILHLVSMWIAQQRGHTQTFVIKHLVMAVNGKVWPPNEVILLLYYVVIRSGLWSPTPFTLVPSALVKIEEVREQTDKQTRTPNAWTLSPATHPASFQVAFDLFPEETCNLFVCEHSLPQILNLSNSYFHFLKLFMNRPVCVETPWNDDTLECG